MPIKFRCPNCRQFLGISRAKAGSVTDCPSCGRSLRVPNLDGKVAPLPKPELNLGDAALANALDALAGFADISDAEDSPKTSRPVSPLPVAISAAVVSIAPAPPPVIVEVHAPPPLPKDSVRKLRSVRDPDVRSPSNEAVLNSLAAMAPASSQPVAKLKPVRQPLPAWLSKLRSALILLLIGCGAGAATAFYFVGPGRTTTLPKIKADGQPVTDAPSAPDLSAFVPASFTTALTGRVTYTTDTGEGRPDSEARIIVLPEQRTSTVKLSTAAFRAGATDVDKLVARASLRAMGGDFTQADAEGKYEAFLPSAGQYVVLIISRHQEDRDPTALDSSLAHLLETYFDKPSQLTGRVKHKSAEFKFDGANPSPRDQSFDRR